MPSSLSMLLLQLIRKLFHLHHELLLRNKKGTSCFYIQFRWISGLVAKIFQWKGSLALGWVLLKLCNDTLLLTMKWTPLQSSSRSVENHCHSHDITFWTDVQVRKVKTNVNHPLGHDQPALSLEFNLTPHLLLSKPKSYFIQASHKGIIILKANINL